MAACSALQSKHLRIVRYNAKSIAQLIVKLHFRCSCYLIGLGSSSVQLVLDGNELATLCLPLKALLSVMRQLYPGATERDLLAAPLVSLRMHAKHCTVYQFAIVHSTQQASDHYLNTTPHADEHSLQLDCCCCATSSAV